MTIARARKIRATARSISATRSGATRRTAR
jgi:hypothetical protein